MYWQRRYIRENVTFTRNDTYRLDLPDKGMLGSILLKIVGTQVNDYTLTRELWRIIDHLTDVQVILNGSHPCKDLTGYQAQALNWMDQGVMPNTKWNQYGTCEHNEFILINFGRKLMDPEMGLDLSMFDNVQLRLTNTATSSYYGSDFTVSVLGYFKEEGGGFPMGFIKSEQFKSWSPTANTWEYTDLPTEGKLRRLVLRLEPDEDDTLHGQDCRMDYMGSDIKITFDSGATVVYEGGIDDLMREINLLKGRDLIVYQIPYRTATYANRNGAGRIFAYAVGEQAVVASTAKTVITTIDSDYDRGTWGLFTHAGNASIIGIGTCPHYCLEIPFIDSDNPADWLDLAMRKTMKVDIHAHDDAGVTGGHDSIVIERQVF